MGIESNYIKYKVNFISFIKPCILPVFLFLLFVLLYIPIIIFTKNSERYLVPWIVGICWISITFIPIIILHINYYFNDRKKQLVINNLKKKLSLIQEDQIKEISYNEIEVVEKYSADLFFSRLPFKTYYYYKIIIKNKAPLYISRMIIEKLERKINISCIEFNSVFYPFILRDAV